MNYRQSSKSIIIDPINLRHKKSTGCAGNPVFKINYFNSRNLSRNDGKRRRLNQLTFGGSMLIGYRRHLLTNQENPRNMNIMFMGFMKSDLQKATFFVLLC